MADFVAVLRKTIGSLGENSPEMREKVYDKARATIEAKLMAINPPPPAAVVDRQRQALEDAIAVVRADYDKPAVADTDEDLEDVFASLKSMGTVEPRPTAAKPAAPAATAPVSPEPAPKPVMPSTQPSQGPLPLPPDPVLDRHDDEVISPAVSAEAATASAAPAPRRPTRSRSLPGGRTGLVAALGLLLVVGAGGYVWMNQDDLFKGPPPAAPVAEAEPGEDSAPSAEEVVETPPAEEDVAAAPPAAEEETPSAAQQPDAEPDKFTQRLLADGSEVDEGPAQEAPTIGEGTSVATAAQIPQEEGEAPARPEAGAAGEEPAEGETSAVAVGQRAIFYEERTTSAQGSAEMGQIVWSIVQESPGGDLPPEPAIRAEATVPDKDVQLRMTIRRNGDQTLPASHIVEMIFLTPDGFEGGAIANVSRISFKETEQAAGNPLIGIPAKIADGFFLIALGDTPAEVETNMTLLRRQSWIDIPIVYQTGRRALLTLEKGIPGDRVFDEALRAWSEASSG